MADEAVTIVAYDPAWADRFRDQRDRLSVLLKPWLKAQPEHVGSTSVPGLQAKPIVDILAPVVLLTEAETAVAVLERDGWLFWPDDPNRSYRMWFLRPNPAARTHHLQIMQHDHPEVHALRTFRDALCRDPELRETYASLKCRLAEQHRSDRNAYTDAKSDFVRSVLRAHGAASAHERLG
jgi:GrpB-like predicted nucleotidyltransferase (UPF0157 family)